MTMHNRLVTKMSAMAISPRGRLNPSIVTRSNGASAISPNKTTSWSKWTLLAYLVTRMTPMLNNAGNTMPMAASSFTNCVRCSSSTRLTVATPVPAAKIRSMGEST